jgi:peptidoglycan/LPS O-acetylase OafA/YrhL
MSPAVSIKLHALRLVAALLVVATHANQLGYTGPSHGVLEPLGRLGVIVFFVLSGYVIAHVSQTRHHDLRSYMLARFGRLHSVLIPALAVTALADLAGSSLEPHLYAGFPPVRDPGVLATAPLFASFMYQSFGNGMRWLSNSPLWSIAYEFWYYVLFGTIVYLRGAMRWLAVVGTACLCGLKILLLWPIWLVGVLLYRERERIAALTPRVATLAGILSVAILTWLCLPTGFSELSGLRDWGIRTIGQNFSAFVLWDLVLVLPICLSMIFVSHPDTAGPGPGGSAWIKSLADGTFSIYCYHLPLLLLARATGFYAVNSPTQSTLAAIGVVIICLVLSTITERRKRPWLRLWGRILRVERNADPYARDAAL